MGTLTIVLGKKAAALAETDWSVRQQAQRTDMLLFYPEVTAVLAKGLKFCPLHPDDYIPAAMSSIYAHIGERDVELWTLSEYLVSAVALAVADKKLTTEQVKVKLYDSNNLTYRTFGISDEGYLIDTGDGDWPYGWFLPNV